MQRKESGTTRTRVDVWEGEIKVYEDKRKGERKMKRWRKGGRKGKER